jgi:hypothetical protein
MFRFASVNVGLTTLVAMRMKETFIIRRFYLWYYFSVMKSFNVRSVTFVETAVHAQVMCDQFL